MSAAEKWKWAYKVVRSVLFTTIGFIVFLYVALYIALSLPGVQNGVRKIAENELSKLTGGTVHIGNVDIYPFNEVIVEDVALTEPDGRHRCLQVERVGAGISLWNLVRYQRIIITYAELIGMDARIRQDAKDGALNIQFLIDAFKPKDKNKPPAKFDLRIGNIVIRKGSASFDRAWLPAKPDGVFDINHLSLSGLNADVALPRLSDSEIKVDLRRLAFILDHSVDVRKISALAVIAGKDIDVKNLEIEFQNTKIKISDQHLPLSRYADFRQLLDSEHLAADIEITDGSPSEFALFYPPLAKMSSRFNVSLSADGNADAINVQRLSIVSGNDFNLNIHDLEVGKDAESGKLSELTFPEIRLTSTSNFNFKLAEDILPGIDPGIRRMIAEAGNLDFKAEGSASLIRRGGSANIDLKSGYGNISLLAEAATKGTLSDINLSLISEDFNLGRLLASEKIGVLDFTLNADASLSEKLFTSSLKGKSVEFITSLIPAADVNLNVTHADINSYPLSDVQLSFLKDGNSGNIDIQSTDENFDLGIAGSLSPIDNDYRLTLNGDIGRLRPAAAALLKPGVDFDLSGNIDIDVSGNFADPVNTIAGEIELSDLRYADLNAGKSLELDKLSLHAAENEEGRVYTLLSDWMAGNVSGRFTPTHLPLIVKDLLSRAFPDIFPQSANSMQASAASAASGGATRARSANGDLASIPPADAAGGATYDDVANFQFKIFRGGSWQEFLNLPVKLLYEAELRGSVNGPESTASLNLSAPYIQQGKDKLIQKTDLSAEIVDARAKVGFYSSIPTKKGVLDLQGDIISNAGLLDMLLQFNPGSKGAFYGDMHLQAEYSNVLSKSGRNVRVNFLPSKVYLNGAAWDMGDAVIDYHDDIIDIRNFSISHGNQFITIAGTASQSPEDEVVVKLKDIDLSYVFDTLNIDVAQFGGIATGEAVGRSLLSKNLEAFTRNLHVEDLSYNHTVLGDGDLKGDFDINEKRVGIYADIHENGRYAATVDGAIWIGRDSLSFGFNAEKVRIGFLQYYMKAFASEVAGRASGKALLYGTFKDVNMKGRLFADSIAIKVDYTNVTYSGTDSVSIDPGYINIPLFTLHDKYGNKAKLSGVLTHDNFHHPKFDFRIFNADKLLIYDTNASMNPIWYGHLFGSGGGRVYGDDNFVKIEADMVTEGNSNFTFVLNDQKDAADYRFLKFTDKRKAKFEAENPKPISEPDEIVKAFQKKVQDQLGPPAVFAMDIRATLTPAVKMTLVMDPAAGDKITARGSGPVNISYDSASDEMKMFGKYTIDEGVYNFSLQDLILKDFIIKQGSSVSFNGDPMQAMLNIRGAYRVNTNLTDLDQSFATDKDLNRVNVPVDAMLLVNGDMEHPDIKFDIELPTLNSETEQKVRSIISSEDMMNTQMIYLLALNRFYTPQYAGNGNSGGEWASVASSTISSQLANILGQMTDKVTISPSFRSDKGDFSDLQVDVALSSRLFNNRLLINGNFGYRDRSTSSTTFIGDFDIEYLLNRSGTFRLKAYNHFNDQNYYLKSALTTQGIGVLWRREFDRLFRKKKKEPQESPEQP